MKKKATTKRLLALVAVMMTACMLLLSFPVSANTTTTTTDTWDGTYNRAALSGGGTETNPFIIDSAEKLMGLAKNVICSSDDDIYKRDGGAWSPNGTRVSKYYRLTVDIDFGGQTIMPIGVAGHSFAGIFDGNGHTIKNFTFPTEVTATKPNGEVITSKGTNGVISLSSHQALFGFSNVDSTAIPAIKNLTVTGATYTHGAKQAGLVSQARGTLVIENCHVSNISWTNTATYIGGIVADAANTILTVKNCTSNITVNTFNNSAKVGGIVGWANGVRIENCVSNAIIDNSTASITGVADVGGILGGAQRGDSVNAERTIINCVFAGNIKVHTTTSNANNLYVGGIVGRMQNGTLIQNTAMYGTVAVSEQSTTQRVGIFAGGFGYGIDTSKDAHKTNQMVNCLCVVPEGITLGDADADKITATTPMDAVGAWSSWNDTTGLKILPLSSTARADMAIKATQESNVYEHTLADNSKVNVMNVRFVANLGVAGDAETDVLTKYQSVGFVITAVHGTNVQDFSQDVNYVYSSIDENTSTGIATISADDARIGGDYIVGIEGKLIPATGTVTFYVTPKLVATNGTVSYGQTATIVYVNGVRQDSAN